MYIPLYLQNKPIPNNNNNPLKIVSEQQLITYIGQINSEILNAYYNKDEKLFWLIIKQLGFLGVQFTGQLAQFTLVVCEDTTKVLVIEPSKWNEPINYDKPSLSSVKHFFLSNGLYCKGDIHGIPIKIFNHVCKGDLNIVEQLKLQGFTIGERAYDNINVRVKREYEMVKDKGYIVCDHNKIDIDKSFFEYSVEEIDFSRCPKVLEKLKEQSIKKIEELPVYLDELKNFKGIGDVALNKFFVSLQRLLERSVNQVQAKSLIRDIGEYIYNNRHYSIPNSLLNYELNREDFHHCPTVVNKLNAKGVRLIGDLPSNLKELNELKRVDVKVINQFTFCLEKLAQKTKNIKLITLWDQTISIPKELVSVPLTQENFPNSYNNLKNYKKRGFKTLDDLISNDICFQNNSQFNEDLAVDLKQLVYISEFTKHKDNFLQMVSYILEKETYLNIKQRDWEIFKLRMLPKKDGDVSTLEEIGMKYNLTKERVRQICIKITKKVLSKNMRFIEIIKDMLESNNKIIEFRYLIDIPLSLKKKLIIQKLFEESEIIYDYKLDVVYLSKITDVLNDYCDYIMDNLSPVGISVQELDKITCQYLKLGNKTSIKSIDTLRQFAIEYVLIPMEEGYSFKNVNKVDLVVYVFKKYFSDGLAIYKDIDLFKDKILKLFPDEFSGDNDRNIVATLLRGESEVLLWGRGYYVHRSHIQIHADNLEDIIQEIKNDFDDGLTQIPVYKFFRANEEYLIKIGIPNEYALYTCLRMYFSEILYLPKYPWVLPADNELGSNSEVIEHYMIEVGDEISFDSLRLKFVKELGWKEDMLQRAINCSEKILRAELGIYNHLNNLEIEQTQLQTFVMLIKQKLEKEDTVSIRLIFKERKATCLRLNIKSEILLYNLLKHYYSDEMQFLRYPFVKKLGAETEDELNYRKIVEEFIKDAHGTIFRSELKEKFEEKLGWARNSLDNAISFSPSIIPVIYRQEYVHRKVIGWNTEKQKHLERVLIEYLDKLEVNKRYFISIIEFLRENSLENFPILENGIQWTEDILSCLINESQNLMVLGTRNLVLLKDPNPLNIEDEIDLIAYILKTKFSGATKIRELEKILQQLDLISSQFPKSYQNVDEELPYIISGNEIILNELRDLNV